MSVHMTTKKQALMVLAAAVACMIRGEAVAASKPAPSLAGITVSYKLDPRLTSGLYMGDRWVAPATYNSINTVVGKSLTVEARAQGYDAAGRRWKVNPQWIPSDPEMVTVSPARGSAVTITVRRPGESTITLKAAAIATTLTLRTVLQGETWRVDILQKVQVPSAPPSRSRRAPPQPEVKAAAAPPGAPAN
jgi:hypothetical protein